MQVRRALLGDHQGVPAADRVDVQEGEHALVLVDAVAGDLAPDDLAEDRLAHTEDLSQVSAFLTRTSKRR